jgi:hypothetical protein
MPSPDRRRAAIPSGGSSAAGRDRRLCGLLATVTECVPEPSTVPLEFRRILPVRCCARKMVFGTFWRLHRQILGRDNLMVAQMSLFSRGDLAEMRDRTAARNYSAERDAFRREHERHRAWGLRQRHARKLVRSGWGASAAWAAVTAGDDRQRQAVSVIPAPQRPDPAPSQPDPAPQRPDPAPRWPDPAPRWSDLAASQPDSAPQRPDPAPQRPDLGAVTSAGRVSGGASPSGSAGPRQESGPASAVGPALASGCGRAGLFLVLVGWCVMVVKVALDGVGCCRDRCGHRAMIELRADIREFLCWGWEGSGGRGPPLFGVPSSMWAGLFGGVIRAVQLLL